MKTQFNRLPNGSRVVKQDGYQHRGGWSKYAIFSKSGYMILLTGLESNIVDARNSALLEINKRILDIKMAYGSLYKDPLQSYLSNLK